jgi:hypothetical protein
MSFWTRNGRPKPYTARGIRRLRCVRCGAAAEFQWRACADDNWRPLCAPCDVGLNAAALRYMRDPEAKEKIAAYRRAKLGKAGQ